MKNVVRKKNYNMLSVTVNLTTIKTYNKSLNNIKINYATNQPINGVYSL